MNYFFALPLGSLAKHIHNDLLQPLQAIDVEEQLSWSPYENLHITLAYLGPLSGTAVSESARGRAMQAARLKVVLAVAEQVNASNFKCKIENLGFFPDAASRVLALHVQPCAGLIALQGALQNALFAAGISCDDRSYRPHITLARLKHRQHISTWQLPEYSASLDTRKFALYSSEQGRAKLYQKIAEFSL